ncbi:hypothetical protein [Deinococcus sp.]|uniref:hypothetical protein n=1 Tax=Deinococcus sp. TaxID=47478 RepID=UPI003C79DA6A
MPTPPFFRVWRPQVSPLLELVLAQTGHQQTGHQQTGHYRSAVHLHDELEHWS